MKKITEILSAGGIEEAAIEAKLILTSVCGLTYEQILAGATISDDAEKKACEIAKKRVETGAPIQHLLGFANFMGEKFKVSVDVLIPRDETEILVRETEKIIQQTEGKAKVLDIGTGSGIIPIMLAKIFSEKVEVLGVDISTAALSIAIENAQSPQIKIPPNLAVFRKSDLFSNIHENETFDIILSNPPYIPQSEIPNLQKEVVGYEPHLALFTTDERGLEFYEKIIKGAKAHLNPNGYILFELGVGQADEVSKILTQDGFCDIAITKDLAGIERVISACHS